MKASFTRSRAIVAAIAGGEYADSRVSITGNPRALRHPAPQPLQLAPLVVRPAP